MKIKLFIISIFFFLQSVSGSEHPTAVMPSNSDVFTDSDTDVSDSSPDYTSLIARTKSTRFQPGNQAAVAHTSRWSLTHSLSLADALKYLETHKAFWSCQCRPQCRHYALHFLRRGLKSDSVLVAVAKKFWPDISVNQSSTTFVSIKFNDPSLPVVHQATPSSETDDQGVKAIDLEVGNVYVPPSPPPSQTSEIVSNVHEVSDLSR